LKYGKKNLPYFLITARLQADENKFAYRRVRLSEFAFQRKANSS